MNPFSNFLGRRVAPRVLFHLVFCPCQHSPNEIPKIGRWARMHECTEQTLSDRHTSHTSMLAGISSFPVLIKIPYWDSFLPLRLPGLVTQPPTGDKISNFQQRRTHMHRDTHGAQSKLFLRQLVLLPPFMCGMKVSFRWYVWERVWASPPPAFASLYLAPPSHCHYFRWCPPLICRAFGCSLSSLCLSLVPFICQALPLATATEGVWFPIMPSIASLTPVPSLPPLSLWGECCAPATLGNYPRE